LDHTDPDAYLALNQGTFANGSNLRFHLRVERQEDAANRGRVEVFFNSDPEPVLSARYHNFPATPPPTTEARIEFGSPQPVQGEIRIDTDYLTWKTYKSDGGLFRAWDEMTPGINRIRADNNDAEVVPTFLLTPPGITAGQSQQACMLDVLDPAEVCEIRQMMQVSDSPTYKIDVDYKMDIGGVEGELVVQRLPDLHYWDEGSGWSDTFKSVTLGNQSGRTRFSAMTGINVSTANEELLVTVKRKTNIGPSYKILVYKVFLDEE